jgi:hypothetical protein
MLQLPSIFGLTWRFGLRLTDRSDWGVRINPLETVGNTDDIPLGTVRASK